VITARPPLCVVSLGGNALPRRGERGTIDEHFANTRACTAAVALITQVAVDARW